MSGPTTPSQKSAPRSRRARWIAIAFLAGCNAQTAEPMATSSSVASSNVTARPSAPPKGSLSPGCLALTEMTELEYSEANVAKMLAAATACSTDGSLIGKDRAFVARYFPPPIPPQTPGEPQQTYYAGRWRGDGGAGSMAWKQVKMLFCFDDGGAVREVRAAHAHQDLACPE